MGKSKIPGPLERRHLIERELDAAHAKRIADAYLEEDRKVEAIDFLEKAGAEEELESLCREARTRGDVFLLRAASTALERRAQARRLAGGGRSRRGGGNGSLR